MAAGLLVRLLPAERRRSTLRPAQRTPVTVALALLDWAAVAATPPAPTRTPQLASPAARSMLARPLAATPWVRRSAAPTPAASPSAAALVTVRSLAGTRRAATRP